MKPACPLLSNGQELLPCLEASCAFYCQLRQQDGSYTGTCAIPLIPQAVMTLSALVVAEDTQDNPESE
jgi:hypothetical protein